MSQFTVATQSKHYFQSPYWFKWGNKKSAGRQGQRFRTDLVSGPSSHAPFGLGCSSLFSVDLHTNLITKYWHYFFIFFLSSVSYHWNAFKAVWLASIKPRWWFLKCQGLPRRSKVRVCQIRQWIQGEAQSKQEGCSEPLNVLHFISIFVCSRCASLALPWKAEADMQRPPGTQTFLPACHPAFHSGWHVLSF